MSHSECGKSTHRGNTKQTELYGREEQSVSCISAYLTSYKNISFLPFFPTSTNFSIITFISTRIQRNPPPDGLCSENSAGESLHYQPLRLLHSRSWISCRGYGRDWTFPTQIQQASSNRRGRRSQDCYRSSLVSYWRKTKYTEATLRHIGKFGPFSHVYS